VSVIVLFEEDIVEFPEIFELLDNILEEEAEAGFPEPEDLFEEDTSIAEELFDEELEVKEEDDPAGKLFKDEPESEEDNAFEVEHEAKLVKD
jgi:hypothetical protein